MSFSSGIEAATVAWHELGWEPVLFSEIAAFPSRLLNYYYPWVPNIGDMTKSFDDAYFKYNSADLIVAGTPCQSFSIAGLRGGLDTENGNLALGFCRILLAKQPRWFVWENVPGVFSSFSDTKDGEGEVSIFGRNSRTFIETSDFASILNGFRECGYSCAYRVLDSQYFGVPQRRRRVFVVGYLGDDWRPPAAVLFESESLRRDLTPRRKKGKEVAGTLDARTNGGGFPGSDGAMNGHVVATLDANYGKLQGTSGQDLNHGHSHLVVPPTLYSIMPQNSGKDYKAREVEVSQPLMAGGPVGGNQGGDFILQPLAFDTTQITSRQNGSNPKAGDPCHPLSATGHAPAIFMAAQGAEAGSIAYSESICPTLRSTPGGNSIPSTVRGSSIRRLTPLECERLQGFPDNYTLIPGGSDSARYKAIGNSMTTHVMRWIGERIELVNKVIESLK